MDPCGGKNEWDSRISYSFSLTGKQICTTFNTWWSGMTMWLEHHTWNCFQIPEDCQSYLQRSWLGALTIRQTLVILRLGIGVWSPSRNWIRWKARLNLIISSEKWTKYSEHLYIKEKAVHKQSCKMRSFSNMDYIKRKRNDV